MAVRLGLNVLCFICEAVHVSTDQTWTSGYDIWQDDNPLLL